MLSKAVFLALSTYLLVVPANAALLSLPYTKCDQSSGCSTVKTGLILDGGSTGVGSTDYATSQVFAYGSNGIQLRAPISRSYLVNAAGNAHEMFKLKNRQISIDVNIAGVQCGYNAAFYFSQMSSTAAIGTGYCDAQNTCNEMDILEANAGASAGTMHACTATGGKCDPWGCGINTYNSYANNVGPGKTIDTTQTYTLTTAFYTDNGADSGTMNKITQTFTQSGKTFKITQDLTDSFCSSADSTYWSSTGGFPAFTKAFDSGMTMIFSFWGTGGTSMSWLDGAPSNTRCSSATGSNQVLQQQLLLLPLLPLPKQPLRQQQLKLQAQLKQQQQQQQQQLHPVDHVQRFMLNVVDRVSLALPAAKVLQLANITMLGTLNA
ncbi:hypothetical protein HK096_007375, partial [Nowakowskiella sp. JEL0078]